MFGCNGKIEYTKNSNLSTENPVLKLRLLFFFTYKKCNQTTLHSILKAPPIPFNQTFF